MDIDQSQDFIETIIQSSAVPNLQLPDPTLIQYYKDIKNRVIWLTGEINDGTLEIIPQILSWNADDVNVPKDKRVPIKIMFLSPGGNLDIEETIISIIRISDTPIYGYALGMVASAASLIYLSCHKRFALPNAYFILHKGSYSNVGANYNELMAAMDDYRIQVEKMIDFYVKNTTIPEDTIRKRIETDWYVRGEDLLTFGLVDQWITNIKELLL